MGVMCDARGGTCLYQCSEFCLSPDRGSTNASTGF